MTVTVSGQELELLGQVVHHEPPIAEVDAGASFSQFGVNIVRRDWPRGRVVRLLDQPQSVKLINWMWHAFSWLHEQEVIKSQRCESDAYRRCSAFFVSAVL